MQRIRLANASTAKTRVQPGELIPARTRKKPNIPTAVAM
jgi:hypothetical protein